MKSLIYATAAIATVAIASCNNNKPKPVSREVTKNAIVVDGKKDSVLNNTQKNYGNATVSEPCLKCLLKVIQSSDSYKKFTSGIAPQVLVYNVNWITSSKPLYLGNGSKIINGMKIDIQQKNGRQIKNISTYAYNNAVGRIYLSSNNGNYQVDQNVSDTSLQKIRNACFWGVSSAK